MLLLIHGDSFDYGTGNSYDVSLIASLAKIVVITINYRLGVLGFFSTGDSQAPGNYAILDIVAALHWIKDNIASFYGDPNKVTILGHGAGGALVHLLLISPITKSRPLLHGSIILGASAFTSWSLVEKPSDSAAQLSLQTNCSQRVQILHSHEFVGCLKGLAIESLIQRLHASPKYLSTFGPTVDSRSVMPLNSNDNLAPRSQNSAFQSTPLMVGIVPKILQQFFNQAEFEHGLMYHRYTQMLRTYLRNRFSYHRQHIYDILHHQYIDWDNPPPQYNNLHNQKESLELRDSLGNILTDGQILSPLLRLAKQHAMHSPAHTFLFSLDTRNQLQKLTYGMWFDDIGQLLGYPLFNPGLSDGNENLDSSPWPVREREASLMLLKYVSNFVYSGNPNLLKKSGQKISDADWPRYNMEKQQYVEINGDKKSIQHHFKASKMALWLDLIPRIHVNSDPDSSNHQLENWDDSASFEANFTKHDRSAFKDLILQTVHDLNDPPMVGAEKSVQNTPMVTAIHRSTPFYSLEASNRFNTARTSVPLAVTVAVGCCLLLLNIGIFVALYREKNRLRRTRDLLKTDLNHQIPSHPGDLMQAKICGRRSPSSPTETSDSLGLLEDANRNKNCNMRYTIPPNSNQLTTKFSANHPHKSKISQLSHISLSPGSSTFPRSPCPPANFSPSKTIDTYLGQCDLERTEVISPRGGSLTKQGYNQPGSQVRNVQFDITANGKTMTGKLGQNLGQQIFTQQLKIKQDSLESKVGQQGCLSAPSTIV